MTTSPRWWTPTTPGFASAPASASAAAPRTASRPATSPSKLRGVQRTARSFDGEVAGRLAVRGAAALADAGALANPGVVGVHHLGEVVIGHDLVGQIVAHPRHCATQHR